MVTYPVDLAAEDVLLILRASIQAEKGQPELNITAEIDYVFDERFKVEQNRFEQREQFDLVTSIARLSVEPRVEEGYWVLETTVERKLGPQPVARINAFAPRELTLDEFDAELHAPGERRVTVKLHAQSPEVKQDFEAWLAQALRLIGR